MPSSRLPFGSDVALARPCAVKRPSSTAGKVASSAKLACTQHVGWHNAGSRVDHGEHALQKYSKQQHSEVSQPVLHVQGLWRNGCSPAHPQQPIACSITQQSEAGGGIAGSGHEQSSVLPGADALQLCTVRDKAWKQWAGRGQLPS